MKEIINTMSKYLIKLEQCLVDFKQKNKEPFLTCSENGPNLIKSNSFEPNILITYQFP